jgi:hypothetical protein
MIGFDHRDPVQDTTSPKLTVTIGASDVAGAVRRSDAEPLSERFPKALLEP